MSVAVSQGLDAEGFIRSVAQAPVQPEYQPVLADACSLLSQQTLGLDGLYVYGSVARGDATPGQSDLDLTLVLREPQTPQVAEQLERVRRELERRHPHVTKVDFDIGERAQVMAVENRNLWGFWLKHQCRCIWGNDLCVHFERFRPCREIALALNGDVYSVLNTYICAIGQTVIEADRLRLQREASRKLIRATQILRSEAATMWPQTLEEHVAMFLQSHPAMVTQVAFFLFEARNPGAAGDQFCARLQVFVEWLVSQQRETLLRT